MAEPEDDCAICLEALTRPQLLPCGHRFCRACIDSLRDRGLEAEWACPMCRMPLPVPEHQRKFFAAIRKLDAYERLTSERYADEVTQRTKDLLLAGTAKLREVVEADPGHARAHSVLAFALDRSGNLEASVLHRRRAIAAGIAAGVQAWVPHDWNGMGLTLLRSGDVDGAEAAFRTSIAADPQYVRGYTSLGALLGNSRGDHEGAAETYRRCLNANPNNPMIEYFLAMAHRNIERFNPSSSRTADQQQQQQQQQEQEFHIGMGADGPTLVPGKRPWNAHESMLGMAAVIFTLAACFASKLRKWHAGRGGFHTAEVVATIAAILGSGWHFYLKRKKEAATTAAFVNFMMGPQRRRV